WRVADLLTEIADIFDATIGRRVDLDNIGRAALVDGSARWTLVAGALVRIGMLAIDGFGKQSRSRRLAGAARTAEEVGMRDTILSNRVFQRAADVLLPNELGLSKCLGTVLAIE